MTLLSMRRPALRAALIGAMAAITCVVAQTAAAAETSLPVRDPATGVTVLKRWDGTTLRISPEGIGTRTDPSGRKSVPIMTLPAPRGAKGRLQGTPNDLALARRMAIAHPSASDPRQVLIVLDKATVTGAPMGVIRSAAVQSARTSDEKINAALSSVGARSLRQLAPRTAGASALVRGHPAAHPAGALDLSKVLIAEIEGVDARTAARRLAATPGVAYASPNWTVSSFASDPVRIPEPVLAHAPHPARAAAMAQGAAVASGAGLPDNYAVATSESSFLNSSGVDAIAAYATLAGRFGQLPGAGTIITNVSLGDLTDQQMADNGDDYVSYYGPTTRVIDGQRYLDYPSLPLIPTWVAHPDGSLDPLGSVENVDPYLGEVLLDFSVMAPLPHALQRPEATGSTFGDLLGIAPGASYRLVVPEQPTIGEILVAALAAARQSPRPDVMNLSLGFGFDSAGFPGRFLEDDALSRSVMQSISAQGIVVTISVNDGMRAYTNAAIGPDGGSAPTELALPGQQATDVYDVAYSTTPSITPDTGTIAVGGSTLDDIFSVPPQNLGALSRQGSFPTTRLNGAQGFSSGFGSRVNVSAPSDNIPALLHVCQSSPCNPQDSVVVLDGGTSASAPMTAAAAAIVIQAARLSGRSLSVLDVRNILSRTGRVLPQAPQTAQPINVGPQIDVAAAVNAVLGRGGRNGDARPAVVRIGVAHREWADYNLGADFVELTDAANIDLAGPYDTWDPTINYGQNVNGPVTLSADVVGRVGANASFRWTIGSTQLRRAASFVRFTPAEILAMAGLPLVSASPRTVPVSFSIEQGGKVVSAMATTITFAPTDGTYTWPLAPVVPGVVAAGRDVPVSYDLTPLRSVSNPLLVVSSVDHWNALSAPKFRQQWSMPLAATAGRVLIPAAAFGAGDGIYGVSIVADDNVGDYGQFAAVHVVGNGGEGAHGAAPAAGLVRPDAPTLGATAPDATHHMLTITRATPQFALHYDVSSVPGADGAFVEISAPAPTIYGLYSTFTNQNGSARDANGADSGSVLWRHAGGNAGTLDLNAVALGLSSSLFYSVRVLPAHGHRVVGQASPVSTLEFDEGPLPSGIVTSFAIDPAGSSFVTVDDLGAGGLAASSVLAYDAHKGVFGAPLATDSSGIIDYSLLGVDHALGLVTAISDNYSDYSQRIASFDSVSGSMVSSAGFAPVPGSWNIVAAQSDEKRHRLALLALNPTDYGDNVLAYSPQSGTTGQPVLADVDGASCCGVYNALALDKSSGMVFPMRSMLADLCVVLRGGVGKVDLDRAVATALSDASSCISGAAPDNKGGQLYLTLGPLFSYPALLPIGRLQAMDQASLSLGDQTDMSGNAPLFPVVDAANGVFVTGFIASANYFTDNNAMSAVGVFDASTGAQLAYLPNFNFVDMISGSGGFNWLYTRQGIQLDPATRTGWTFGPFGGQLQRFKY